MSSKYIKGNVPVLATATIYMAGITGYLKFAPTIADNFKQFCDTLGINQGLGVALLSIPLLFSILSLFIKAIKAWQARRQLDNATQAANYQHGYFRITPFSGSHSDIAEYQAKRRPDGLEEQLTEWIDASHEPILFLTGKSGTGKSSILAAAVLPELQQKHPELNIVTTRIYNNPAEDIRHTLLKPNTIWQKPPADLSDDLYKMLEKAAARGLLLLVIDQFEELLILHSKEVRAPVETLLQQISATPIKGLTVLLVCREDYLPQLEEAKRFLPTLRGHANWRQVGLFSRVHAQHFLKASNTQMSEKRINTILNEASTIEESRGIFRPIILNMLGQALERKIESKTWLGLNKRSGRLSQLLEQEIGRDPVPRDILAPMITEGGTKKPIPVSELASVTGHHQNNIQAALTRLSTSGIVRRLSEYEDYWEISHDFIARLLVGILTTWKASFLRKAKQWFLPLCSLLLVIALGLPESEEARLVKIQKKLADLNIELRTNHNQRLIVISSATDKDIEEKIQALIEYQRIKRITSLTLSGNDELHFIPSSLEQFTSLKKLKIFHNEQLQSLPASLGQLTSLQELDITWNNQLQSLPESLGQLSSLKGLNIMSNYQLQFLPETLGHLTSLQKLQISSNYHLQSLSDNIGHLTSLQVLYIGSSGQLQSLPDNIGQLASLKTLIIEGHAKLQSLPVNLGQLSSLQKLVISSNDQLRSLPRSLGRLASLQELTVYNNAQLQSLPESLGRLASLQELTVENNDQLQSLPESLGRLASLQELTVDHNAQLQSLPVNLGQLSSLQKLVISSNDQLRSLPRSLGRLASLQELTAYNNAQLQSLPENIGQLSSLQKLVILYNSQLRSLPRSLGRLASLQELTVHGNPQLQSLPENIGQLTSLQKLIIGYNDKLVSLPASIGQLASLHRLVIIDNKQLNVLPMSLLKLINTDTISTYIY